MSRNVERAPITDTILAQLRLAGRPVGDAEQPRGGVAGWIGQANADGTNFIAYSVLTPMGGGQGTGSLTEPGEDVPLGFVITNYGVTRSQCEDQADLMRLQLMQVRQVNVSQWSGTAYAYTRQIQTVLVTGFGPIQRMGDTDPHIYGQTDSVSVLTTGA